MSNGAACCAIGVCCESAAEMREKITQSFVRFTHSAEPRAAALLDRMAAAQVIFAPASFGPVLDELSPGWAPLHLDEDNDRDVRAWIDHHGLVFAPASMRLVIQDIAKMAWKHPK